MKKVEVEIKIKLSLMVNERVEIQEVVNNLDYEFYDTTGEADVLDSELKQFDLLDSK